MNFKDIMSLIPSSVSVVSCIENNLVFGCTVSSLVSVDVQEDNPKILFLLKKKSQVGNKIKINDFFTINVLSADQYDIAKKYSEDRAAESILNSSWIISSQFAEISKCRVIIKCKLIEIFGKHAADVFFAQVIECSKNQSLPPLIYDSRRYVKLESG